MNNVDIKVVSAHLGHNDISTTADIYADVLNSMNQKVAQLIDFNLEKQKMSNFGLLFCKIKQNKHKTNRNYNTLSKKR